MVISSGCTGLVQNQKNSTKSDNSVATSSIDKTITEAETNKNISNVNNTQNKSVESHYSSLFISTIGKLGLEVNSISKEGETIQLNYTGNFSNESRTISELKYITAIFAGVVNKSYHNKSKWDITRLNVVGVSSNGSKVWDFRTEDWWAMNYIRGHWDLDSYTNATLDNGHHWNISAQRPEPGGDEYLEKFRDMLQDQTEVKLISIDKHGAEAFLTYETDHELNSSQYFDEVANVVDVYKNLTLPRSLNRTDGWYAGVLNMEVRNGNDTLEWYRYRIRWAEDRLAGEMSREEEAGRLRLSRFLEKDRLRDGNRTAG
jgi:hypothetical protein